MRRKDGWRSLVGIAMLLAVSSGARAAEITVGLRDYTMMANIKGEVRILFRHDDVSLPANAVLGRAVLEIPYSASLTTSKLELVVYPVATAWTVGAVDWSTGWSTAGGDVDGDLGSRVDVDLGRAGTATIDVTSMMKQSLEDGEFADGFLLSVPSFAGEGVSADRAAGLDVNSGTLRISYRQVGHGPLAKSTPRGGR